MILRVCVFVQESVWPNIHPTNNFQNFEISTATVSPLSHVVILFFIHFYFFNMLYPIFFFFFFLKLWERVSEFTKLFDCFVGISFFFLSNRNCRILKCFFFSLVLLFKFDKNLRSVHKNNLCDNNICFSDKQQKYIRIIIPQQF